MTQKLIAKFKIDDNQRLTYFSFSKNQELYNSILSAARQADSSELKIFDQNKILVAELDAFDLCWAWIESFLDKLIIGLFSNENGKVFNSEKDEELYCLYLEIEEKLKWPDQLFNSNSLESEISRIEKYSARMLNLHSLEKEFRIASFADKPFLHKKIYLFLVGLIDCYLQMMSSNPEVTQSFLQKSSFILYQNIKQPKLRTITFCAAIKDYILTEEEYQSLLSGMEYKFLDILNEWYF